MGMEALAKALTAAIGGNRENQGVSHFIDTGFPPLNQIICNNPEGGLPQGRLCEMYGPSSSGKTALATMMMIQAQQAGGIAGFMDHERSFDIKLAKNMGLNDTFPHWIYQQPATWEESNMNMAKAAKTIREEKAIPADAPILFVFDSIASALPKSMLDKDMDEFNMNDTTALARVTSTTLKVMAAFAEKYNFTILYLNQIRTKPGVVYGDPTCLRGDTVVPFVDGTSATIREIVDGRIDKSVWSFNEETRELEPKKIIDWHDNGPLPKGEDWIFIRTDAVQTKNGAIGMTVTADHKILTEGGWERADALGVGSRLVTKVESSIGGSLAEFIEGVIAGDSCLRAMGSNRKTANLLIQDSNDPEYAKWKVEKMAKHIRFSSVPVAWGESGVGVRYDSEFMHELYEMLPYKRDPLSLLQSLAPMKLALWIMDDGHLATDRECRYTVSVKRKKNDDYMDDLADMLFEKHGLRSRVRSREGALIFDSESSLKIAKLIAPFVPPCMERKLPEALRGQYVDFDLWTESTVRSSFATIKEIRKGSQHRGFGRYDVTVSGNHNYLVGNKQNGVIVHNCTPGGGAMEFYSTVRIALGRKKIMEDRGGVKTFVGQEISMKTTKNKLTRPFQEISWRMMFNEDGTGYFDVTGSMIDWLIGKGKLVQSGARITWTDGKSYYKKALIQHIDEAKLQDELFALAKS